MKALVPVALSLVLVAIGTPADGATRANHIDRLPSGAYVEDQLLVRFHPAIPGDVRRRLHERLGSTLIRKVPVDGWELRRVAAGESVTQAVSAYRHRPEIAFAEPNYLYQRYATTPDDPRFGELWGLNNVGQSIGGAGGTPDADIDAPEAWDISRGSSAVTVAVVDSGVDYRHPELAPRMWVNPSESGGGKEADGLDAEGNGYVDDWHGWDWVGDDNDPQDVIGHGSHVAGILGAVGNNSQGITGVNWDVQIMPLRVIGTTGGTAADIAAAFSYAGAKGARLVNASLGGPQPSQVIADAITGASGTLFVVAAGNGGEDGVGDNNDAMPDYPCSFTMANIVCVAASDQNDGLAFFSNYGSTSVDLAAPGTSILSTIPVIESRFAENFETDISTHWVTGGTNNSWARAQDASGFHLADSPTGPYQPNTDSWIRTSNAISLTGTYGCHLNYFLSLETETNDGLLIEASTDFTNWSQVRGWTGSSGGNWLFLSEDLSQYDGAAQLYIRFRIVTNATDNRDGANIDDVRVRCLTFTRDGREFAFASGSSMAAPYVAGVAALAWAAQPDASPSTIKSALLNGSDPKSSLSGKLLTGGRLNAHNTLSLVTTGTTPSPAATATSTPTPSSLSPPATPSASPSPLPSPSPTPSPEPTPPPSASPTPSPSPEASATSPSPTPRPTPEPTPTAAPKSTVEISLSLAKTRRRVHFFGTLSPAHEDRRVVVTLLRLTRDGFTRVARKSRPLGSAIDLDQDGTSESKYAGSFVRPTRGRCQLRVRFAGDADHAAAGKRKFFKC